ncbi:MAG TPA: SRPBCC domain-containing protein [Xanthomonadaceae bacterium]|jgi:activator of HSP90 ATPase|nr:SRPBCC domain-containing protein [Xanthomonadaceae bacterium]
MNTGAIPDSTHPSVFATTPPRRQVIAGIAAALGGMVLGSRALAQAGPAAMQEKPATVANKARTSLHYDIDFNASPQRIYEALLDAKKLAAFTGLPAEIDRKEGGAFSMFGGRIVGRNVELVANQRIVQAWRPTHWNAGVYSIVLFALKARDAAGASLAFDHTGFPAGELDSLDWGWHHHYWEPLTKFLA